MRTFDDTGSPGVVYWTRVAVLAIGAMLGFFVITNHVSLSPLNNLDAAGSQIASTLSGVIPFTIIAVVFAFRIPWLMLVGMVYSWVWLLLQVRQWWIPYLFGESPAHRSFGWYNEGGYAETVTILPEVSGRPVPDVQHLILELLSMLVVIATTMAYARWWQARTRFGERHQQSGTNTPTSVKEA